MEKKYNGYGVRSGYGGYNEYDGRDGHNRGCERSINHEYNRRDRDRGRSRSRERDKYDKFDEYNGYNGYRYDKYDQHNRYNKERSRGRKRDEYNEFSKYEESSRYDRCNEQSIFNYLQYNKDIDILKKIITSNPEKLITCNSTGFTVLMQAIVNWNINIIDKIIELFKQYYPNNYQEVLQIELNKYNNAHCSTLMAGAKTGNAEIFKKTIEIYEIAYGVKLDENIKDSNETQKQNQQKLRNIITIALETLNNDQCNVLMQVVKKGDADELNTLKELYKKVYPEQYKEKLKEHLKQQEKAGFTILMDAVKNGNINIVNSIIDLYKEAFEKDPKALQPILKPNEAGFTVLMNAVITGNIDIVNSIIDLYQEVFKENPKDLQTILTEPNEAGFAVLMDAVRKRDKDIVKHVIDLYKEAFKGKIEELQTILKPDKKNITVLINAVITRNIDIVKSIINLYNEAFKENQEDLKEILIKPNNAGFSVLMQAIIIENIGILRSVIDLYNEAFKGNPEDLQTILTKPNKAGFTVLTSAVASNNLKIIEAVATLCISVGLPLNFLNKKYISVTKSIITNCKINLNQKINKLNILIQKGLELNPEESWKENKEENRLLFAVHCCSLIHKQNREKLTQLINKLTKLKEEIKYKQNTNKIQRIDNIITNLKLQTQNSYTELLNSFNKLAIELEVSELKNLMEGYVGTPQQFGTIQLSTQREMRGSYDRQQDYGYDSKRQFGNEYGNHGFRSLYDRHIDDDLDKQYRKRDYKEMKGSEYKQQEEDWFHTGRSMFNDSSIGNYHEQKEHGVGTRRGCGWQPYNL